MSNNLFIVIKKGKQRMKFHVVEKNNILSSSDDIESLVDEILKEYELGITDPYMDSSLSKRIIKNAEILGYFIPNTYETKIEYQSVSRSLTEVKGGYKLALRRGAKLYNVTVFNFPPMRIRNSKIDSITGNPNAQIFPYEKERWILLHPVDTASLISYEVAAYSGILEKYINAGRISTEVYNELKDNLELLNINERCAQTLMHEYGHILHWVEFDRIFTGFSEALGVSATQYDHAYNALVLTWFESTGYLYNVAARYPNFKKLPTNKKVYILKESFVEDYRIGLNLSSTDGKIILPNTHCIMGDLMEPSLLREGVDIVRKMVTEIENNNTTYNHRANELETNRIDALLHLDDEIFNTDWKPNKGDFTPFEAEKLINEAFEEIKTSTFKEVAASLVR